MRCDRCPCGPEVECLATPAFCRLAAGGNPRDLAHIRNRSALGPSPPPPPGNVVPPAVAIRATKLGFAACWFSTKDAACGCSGVRCHLLGRIVNLRDCVACLERW